MTTGVQGNDVHPGTLAVWGDISCPWASLTVHRLLAARARLGLDGEVVLDHRPFPLELVNGRPLSKPVLDAEVREIAQHEPALAWSSWQRPDHEWPGTVLVALEAVQAAKRYDVGGLAASEQLDAALRQALFADGRPVQLLTEVLDIAVACDRVDVPALERAMADGEGRAAVVEGWRTYERYGVEGSPHVFTPDGRSVHNPGIRLEKDDSGHPRIASDDPSVVEDLVRAAAGRPPGR